MALLNKKLKASSLPEVLIASVILMTIFMLSTYLLVSMIGGKEDSPDMLTAESDIRMVYDDIVGTLAEPFKDERQYDWGELIIDAEDYSENTLKLTLTACFLGNRRNISYKCLIEKIHINETP